MIIDLRSDGQLSGAQAKEMTLSEAGLRSLYTDYVGEIASVNNIFGVGWLASVTSRDPFGTRCYDNVCRLSLIERYLTRGEIIDEILVDDDVIGEAVAILCDRYSVSTTINASRTSANKVATIIENVFRTTYYILSSFVYPKIIRGKIKPRRPIIYLDTFVSHLWVDELGTISDKYFPGLLDRLDDNELKDRVWYAPIFYAVRTPKQFISTIRAIRRDPSNYLLMEDWITVFDYIHALYLSVVIPSRIKIIPTFMGLDINYIVKDEIVNEVLSPKIIRSILHYKFVRRLKKNKIDIDLVVDWSENQICDRALNLSIRKYFPNTRIIGYQGFIVSDYYFSHEPSAYEVQAGTIPDVIYVIHEKLIPRKKKYYEHLEVKMAPAFRFQHLIDFVQTDNERKDIILIALPMNINMSRRMIRLCSFLKDVRYKIYVKLHPAIQHDAIFQSIPELRDERFVITSSMLNSFF